MSINLLTINNNNDRLSCHKQHHWFKKFRTEILQQFREIQDKFNPLEEEEKYFVITVVKE